MPAFVLGCHRSGTSLLSSILRGALGDSARPLGGDIHRSPDNRRGHAESEALMLLNEHLLSIAGSSWHQPFIARPDWEEAHTLSYLSRLCNRLEGHTSTDLWVDKDPRLCLTRDAIAHILLADIPSIAILRDPFQVANSLYLRNGFPLAKGLLIWFLYNYHLYNCCSSAPFCTLLHEDLISHGADRQTSCGLLLESFLAHAFPQQAPSGAIHNLIIDNLDPTLVHHRTADPEQLGLSTSTTQLFTSLWRDIADAVRQDSGYMPGSIFTSALSDVIGQLTPHHRTPVYGHHIAHQHAGLEQRAHEAEQSLHHAQARVEALETELRTNKHSLGHLVWQKTRRAAKRIYNWSPRP